jgi:hypothetical protein
MVVVPVVENGHGSAITSTRAYGVSLWMEIGCQRASASPRYPSVGDQTDHRQGHRALVLRDQPGARAHPSRPDVNQGKKRLRSTEPRGALSRKADVHLSLKREQPLKRMVPGHALFP